MGIPVPKGLPSSGEGGVGEGADAVRGVGELAAANRYLSQRFSMPYKEAKGVLTDIGTEELAHSEMIGSIVYQLTRNLSMDEIKKAGSLIDPRVAYAVVHSFKADGFD